MEELLFCTDIQLHHLNKIAQDIASNIQPPCVVLFKGEMGSGKTTFIKELCKQLGVKETMSSPSFSIVNEYQSGSKEKIYHIDLYRLTSIEECLDIGIEEYLYSRNYCFIEWPQLIEPILPTVFFTVSIKKEQDHTRTLLFSKSS
ncbi:MAG: tRNA (adenosine(37)-N6)-threonylcarbamoyltransferase complex ATPase subunit type 1 TsaE [Bacteroidetes bacterium]|nr:tRNA (adenosine(37)-N6)-threonylcarbamoyltransferase complex ATPase subunit type 1 TsaE [Bacteroidota bacterium]